jgi:flagellar basal-body rod protein FlgG
LVTKDGYKVVGSGGPVQIDLNNPRPLVVGATGEISQGAESKGSLSLTQFKDPSKLTPIPGGYFVADDPTAVASPATGQVRQGYLETSNTSIVSEMANMISAMRAFELNQKVIKVADERMARSISELAPPG